MNIRNLFKKITLRNPFRRKKKVKLEDQITEVPKEWLKKMPKPSTSGEIHTRFKPTKIRIPFLRTGKRVVAGLLLVINIIISQAMLISSLNTQPLFWLFLLNSFIILDYIWKTRRKES